ncbi:tigger transposable element-derived protein 1 [Trichonephila clavipes]|nr:tigger transposable element-derived protein 1 [Trichonephila clavipes]
MFDPSSFANPAPLDHADTSRDVLPRGGTSQTESVPELNEIGHGNEEVVDLARQTNSEVDSDDVQELLNSHNQELKMDDLIEMHEQDIEFLDPVQSVDRMTIGNLSEALSLIGKGLQILENINFNEERIFSTKPGIKKILACYEEILRDIYKKKSFSRQRLLC